MFSRKKIYKLFYLAVLTGVICRSMSSALMAQSAKSYAGAPVKKDNLVGVIRSKQYQAREVAEIINEHGVDFHLTPDVQAELVGAGARPEVIEAIRGNFRPLSKKTAANKNKPNTGVFDAYQNLINQALNQYNSTKDVSGAINTLQRAVKLMPNNSRAYQLLGYANLYGLQNFAEAERNMREAVNHGGSAVFRVFHDHNGTFTTGCSGSLYVARDIIRYEADDNVHTFQTLDANIKEIKINSSLKRLIQIRKGSFRIILKNGDDDKNLISRR